MGLEIRGLEELIDGLGVLAALPEGMVDAMLRAAAAVVGPAQQRAAQGMLRGPFYEGGVAEAVTIKQNTQRAGDGRALYITFEGEQHGNRLAEIAFVNEFGKTNQPARPFIDTANEECADEAVEAAAEVMDSFLRSNGL